MFGFIQNAFMKLGNQNKTIIITHILHWFILISITSFIKEDYIYCKHGLKYVNLHGSVDTLWFVIGKTFKHIITKTWFNELLKQELYIFL